MARVAASRWDCRLFILFDKRPLMANHPNSSGLLVHSSLEAGAAQWIWLPGEDLQSWGLRILHLFRERLPLTQALLYVALEEELLLPIAAYGMQVGHLAPLRWGQGLAGEAAQTKKPILFQLPEAPLQDLAIGYLRATHYWVVPCVFQEEVWGVLKFVLYQAPKAQTEAELSQLLPIFSALLSSAVQQHRIKGLLDKLSQQNALLEEKLAELEKARSQLEQLNTSLEERVQARTAELAKALEELQSAQQQLVLSEKMAALGQLIAGVAHEINSPLGAIKGSSETLLEGLPAFLSHLMAYYEADPSGFFTLLKWARQRLLAGPRPILTSREERALRRHFAQTLTQAGFAEPEAIARQLVEAGLYEEADLHTFLPLLKQPQSLDALYYLGQLRLQLENILLAAQRTRKVVFALKSYAHTSDRDKPVLTDLVESLETILTLYQNQLKQGIEVHTHYAPDLPKLYLFSDEIGQVWTNLIQNAIQAMQGKGRLEIRAACDAEGVLVSITDNGPGIPPEILPRIFDPFFTTKPKGEGTGLGLDICRRIVQKHGGRLYATSLPGETTFYVYLPLHLQNPDWYDAQAVRSSP